MITDDIQCEEVPQRSSAALSDSQLATAAMRRLAARSRLSQVAHDTLRGILAAERATTPTFVGEATGTACMNSPPPTINFDCGAADFNCAQLFGNFQCAQVYDCSDGSTFNCAQKGSFACGTPTGTVDFDCSADIYDCSQFTCNAGGSSSYDCGGMLDFLCDAAYYCEQDFSCTAGHVFLCFNINGCSPNASFACAAGDPNCTPANPYNCSPMYPYSPPCGDGDPGDFICGGGPQNVGPIFYCWGDFFTCAAGDQFDCNENATFNCGYQPNGVPTGDFSCDATDEFACDYTYNCMGTYCGCTPGNTYTGCCGTTPYSPPQPPPE